MLEDLRIYGVEFASIGIKPRVDIFHLVLNQLHNYVECMLVLVQLVKALVATVRANLVTCVAACAFGLVSLFLLQLETLAGISSIGILGLLAMCLKNLNELL